MVLASTVFMWGGGYSTYCTSVSIHARSCSRLRTRAAHEAARAPSFSFSQHARVLRREHERACRTNRSTVQVAPAPHEDAKTTSSYLFIVYQHKVYTHAPRVERAGKGGRDTVIERYRNLSRGVLIAPPKPVHEDAKTSSTHEPYGFMEEGGDMITSGPPT